MTCGSRNVSRNAASRNATAPQGSQAVRRGNVTGRDGVLRHQDEPVGETIETAERYGSCHDETGRYGGRR